VTELPLEQTITVIVFTDGVWGAGLRSGTTIQLPAIVNRIDPEGTVDAQTIADAILADALRLDHERPQDDVTVLVVRLFKPEQRSDVRRLFMRFPV
jgi:serine phosphatase RsbU (regulator of sigma subunit)